MNSESIATVVDTDPFKEETPDQQQDRLTKAFLTGLEKLVNGNVIICHLENGAYLMRHNQAMATLEFSGAIPCCLSIAASGKSAMIHDAKKLQSLLRAIQIQIARRQEQTENIVALEAAITAFGIRNGV